MKAIPLFALFLLSSPLMAQGAPVAPGKEPVAAGELMPNQKAFLNLPEESRNDFLKHLGEAHRLFQQKRIFETLDELDKTMKIFNDSPEIYNLRGSCYVEMRAFDKALADFQKAMTYVKANPSIEFNIGEVYFCTKEWKKSLEVFEKIFKDIPKEQTALSRLVEFKVMLCKNQLGMEADVKVLAEKYDFEDDSPFYYYAQAVLAYEKKDLVKAEEWLARVSRVFQNPDVLAPWQDTLVEYGYIKSFYGDDAAAASD
jgi:tetratricopeptide (TPR) repeat protein